MGETKKISIGYHGFIMFWGRVVVRYVVSTTPLSLYNCSVLSQGSGNSEVLRETEDVELAGADNAPKTQQTTILESNKGAVRTLF